MIKYPLKFQAAVLEKNNSPLVIQVVEFQGPLSVGQVLVKLSFSGICGKQLEEIEGSDGEDRFLPHLLGHEGTGTVADTGPGVTKAKIGDTVVLHWMKGNGINSSPPKYNDANGRKLNAGWVTTFNELAVVSENRITVVPNTSDMMVAALLGCAVTTGVGTVINQAQVKPYDTALVYGCGGVGLSVVQGLKLAHPRAIIAVDISEKALALARDLGATHCVNPKTQDVVSEVWRITGGKGASKVLINTGNPKAIETALETTAVPGNCYFVGRPPRGMKIAVDPLAIFQQRTVSGSHGGDSIPDRDIPTYLQLHEEGSLNLSKLVSRVLPFSDINLGINLTRSDNPGRCILSFA